MATKPSSSNSATNARTVSAIERTMPSKQSVTTAYNDRVVPLKHIADAYAVNVIDAVNKANAGIFTAEEALKAVHAANVEIKQEWAAYVGATLTKEEREHADEALKLFEPANRDIDKLEAALKALSGKVPGRLSAFNGPLYNTIDPISAKIAALIKISEDVTEARRIALENETRRAALENEAKLAAIERSSAVIEFDPDGKILRANALFLMTVGYTEGEVLGQHHRMFLTPAYAMSAEYAGFWPALAAGELKSGQFERVARGGKSVWLEATYNPIFDLEGRVVRVVKIATDITEKVEAARITEAALDKAREAERIREDLDRTLQEMSTPVMPIWDAILLLPLVGVVDSARTDDVMRKSLERISETRSKVFILDISGVPAVDTAVANQLLKITKATQLMGCETIISGLSPAIARTMVDLGVDVGEVRTTATLRDAFSISLRKVGGQTAGVATA